MRTKFYLAAMALPFFMAACSSDDLAGGDNASIDLSNRKALTDVALQFGDGASTRATLGDNAFNSYLTEAGVDGVGACVIDKYDAANATTPYSIVEYISSNYKYVADAESNKWTTSALMVEGNYMFYAPYNEKHMVRDNIKTILPTEQNVDGTEVRSAIKDFYESGNPVFVGYKFIPAKDQPKTIEVNMRHIFAYPMITISNKYYKSAEDKNDVHFYKDVTITKAKVEYADGSSVFATVVPVNNENVANVANYDSDPKGTWFTKEHESAVTADIFASDYKSNLTNETKTNAINVSFNEGKGVKIEAEKTFSFYLVLPAATYQPAAGTGNGIKVTLYNDQDESAVCNIKSANGVTFNPGKRFPAQEYNTDGSLKATKGAIATLALGEDAFSKVTDIQNNEDLIKYLKGLDIRYYDLKQIAMTSAFTKDAKDEFKVVDNNEVVINSELINALCNYNYDVTTAKGSIEFINKFALGTDVKVTKATLTSDKYTLNVVSNTGKAYKVIVPEGFFQVVSGTNALSVTNDNTIKNVLVDATATAATYAGVNASKITSFNNLGILTISGDVAAADLVINNAENAELTINANAIITAAINNDGTLTNNGYLNSTNNTNNGTITATAGTIKVAAGEGTIENDNVLKVTANAGQTVVYTGTTIPTAAAGLSAAQIAAKKAAEAVSGINKVVLTNSYAPTALTGLTAPLNGCTVKTIELQAGLTTAFAGGSLAGVKLVFTNAAQSWAGSNKEVSVFTDANVEVNTVALTLKQVNVTGKLKKVNSGSVVKGTNGKFTEE